MEGTSWLGETGGFLAGLGLDGEDKNGVLSCMAVDSKIVGMSGGAAAVTVVVVGDAPVSAAVTTVIVAVDDSFAAEVVVASADAAFSSVRTGLLRTGLLRVGAVVADGLAAVFLLSGFCRAGGNNGGTTFSDSSVGAAAVSLPVAVVLLLVDPAEVGAKEVGISRRARVVSSLSSSLSFRCDCSGAIFLMAFFTSVFKRSYVVTAGIRMGIL